MSDPSALLDRLPSSLQGRIHGLRQHAMRRSFAWNVSVMLVGTIIGQAASLVLQPILTRMYTPAQFGYLSVYGAVLSIFGVVASLGLEVAIPISLQDDECVNLLALNGLVLTCTTTLVALFAWLVPTHTLDVLLVGSLAHYRWLLPIGFACMGGYYIMLGVATRAGSFREIARTRISQGTSGPASQILLGLAGMGTPGLVLGYVLGQSSGTLLLFSQCVLRQRAWLRNVSWRGIATVARRYMNFPLVTSWSRVLDNAGGGLVLFLLFSACYSSDIAGFMYICDRVIGRPLMIVSTSLLQVFTGEAGRAVTQDPVLLRRRFYQVVPRQFLLAAVWVIVVNLIAAWAFPLFFGPRWAAAVPYLRALSVAYLIGAVLHPVSTTLQILEHQVTAAIWQIFRLVLVIAAVIVARRDGFSAVQALWTTSIVQAVCCVILLGLMVVAIERVVTRHQNALAAVRKPTL
jgi:O-antigen/teichoic acid export membrane protein